VQQKADIALSMRELTRIFHECEAFICKAFKGAAVVRLLQALDNAANGRLALARRVKIFEKLNKKIFATNYHLTTRGKIVNNKRFSLLIKRRLENFHEIFGLMPIRFPVKEKPTRIFHKG